MKYFCFAVPVVIFVVFLSTRDDGGEVQNVVDVQYDRGDEGGNTEVGERLDLYCDDIGEESSIPSFSCDDKDASKWNKTGKKIFEDAMTKCGKSYRGNKDCVSKCIQERIGYSKTCSGCFGNLAQCTKDNCWSSCMWGNTKACRTCTKENCVPKFEACSGFKPPHRVLNPC
jgi:hypothetical protein